MTEEKEAIMKKMLSAVIFVGLMSAGIGAAFAMSCKEMNATTSAPQKSAAVNVGNTICPVTGEKIDESAKATYEYQGKVYNFCCAMCLDDFKKNPAKYIAKVEEELKSNRAQK
jgi:YHS domain-containing protein